MAEENVEAKAKSMGWSPKEEFRGDPERWVDAETYVKRGEEFIPFLRANNKKLEEELSATRGEVVQMKNLLKASQESIEALKEFNSEATRAKAETEKAKLTEKLKEARKEGDVDTELDLQDQISKHNAALAEAEKKPKEKEKESEGPDYTQAPGYKAWKAENDWFLTDKRKTALALGIADELRTNPDTKGLQGKAFLDRVTEEVNKTLGIGTHERRQGKVEEGGRGGGNGGGGSGDSTSYSDLPSEAKAVCDRQALRLVGEGRAFKNIGEWRKHYAKEYFAS